MKGERYRACGQNASTCKAETWAMKAENLHGRERMERI